MRRLTTPELTASLQAIFGTVMNADPVAMLIPTLPPEPVITAERGFDNRILNVESLETLAEAIAHRVVTDPASARAVLDCNLASELDKCRDNLISRLMRRIYRRPLSTAEQASYRAFMDDIAGVDGVEWAIVRGLASPYFHQHLELESSAAAGMRRKVDDFAVASRVAFALTGAAPDDALLDAAQRGELKTLDGIRTQATRLVQSDNAKQRVRKLFSSWLKVAPPDPNPLNARALGIDGAGLGAEARDEWQRFVDYVVFERHGSFEQLWTTNAVFPTTDRVAKLFGVTRSDGPVPGVGAVRGMFFRPAVLMTSATETSLIVRGANTRRSLLCEVFPVPDPALVAAGNAIRDALPPTEHSSRERADAATSGAFCQTCHSRINAMGYALESFGPVGEWRTKQQVLDDQGKIVASFDIDTKVDDMHVEGIGSLANATELAPALSKNVITSVCYAQRVFADSRLRAPTDEDSCLMRELSTDAPTRPVLDTLVAAIVNDDVFYRAEVMP